MPNNYERRYAQNPVAVPRRSHFYWTNVPKMGEQAV
jgi:hypothetical protein